MNLFRNLKITHQFLIVFGILIIGFAAVGMIYKQVLDIDQEGTSLLEQTHAFDTLVNSAARDVSAMNAAEIGFKLTGDLQYVENFEALKAYLMLGNRARPFRLNSATLAYCLTRQISSSLVSEKPIG